MEPIDQCVGIKNKWRNRGTNKESHLLNDAQLDICQSPNVTQCSALNTVTIRLGGMFIAVSLLFSEFQTCHSTSIISVDPSWTLRYATPFYARIIPMLDAAAWD